MKSVFEYDNYRTYLMEWFQDRNGRPSMRGFAQKVKCSPALVSLVVAGERRLDEDWVDAFAEQLKFKLDREKEYFRLLVTAACARSEEVREDARARASAIRSFYHARRLRLAAYQVMATGLGPVLLELARTVGFVPDAAMIAVRLRGRYTPEEISTALSTLVDARLLVPHGNGGLRPAPNNLATDHQELDSEWRDTLKCFHQWAISTASQGLALPAEERRFGATVVAIPLSRCAEVKQLLDEVHERILSLSHHESGEAEEVALVSTQFVMLSTKKR